jgi:hypothetical protein
VFVATALTLALASKTVSADYSPPAYPGYWTTVGIGGALLQDQGPGMNVSDAASSWNSWTGYAKLATGSSGCGTSTSCVIFVDGGATLAWTDCTIEGPTFWAAAHLLGVTTADPDCADYVDPYPIFAISVANMQFDSDQLVHIRRHEVGHALGLWDTTTACWTDSGDLYPLMKNSATNCADFPENHMPTPNEASQAAIRSGWCIPPSC